jgi:rhodanese-related sulfurtransferase
MPDDVLGRINAALEDWEHGPDAARWRAEGGPDDLDAKWAAYCAHGRRSIAALVLTAAGVEVNEINETWALEGSEVVLVRMGTPALPPMVLSPVAPPCQHADWRFGALVAASINRPMSLLSGVVC